MSEEILRHEIFFSIYKFLENGPLSELAQNLRRELEAKNLLPPDYDWATGNQRPNSLKRLEQTNPHITANYLFEIFRQVQRAVNHIDPPPIRTVPSFLTSGRFSLIRSIPSSSSTNLLSSTSLPNLELPFASHTSISCLSNHKNHAPLLYSSRFSSQNHPGNVASTIFARQLSGPKPISHMWSSKFYEQFNKYRRVLGHLSAVFCVLFDRTGRFIITGSDDKLLKIWSAENGRLLASLRGHEKEITDISISMENDILASGSNDKTIRLWNLQNTALITTLKAHDGAVSAVKFCPLMTTNKRYLISTSQDGSLCFFQYDYQLKEFKNEPIKFVERKRRDAQILSCSFSAGGAFFAVGTADAMLYVYHLSGPLGPTKILEIEQHTDHVDSLQFSNLSLLKFISGGKDGRAHIWNYKNQTWHYTKINVTERLRDATEPNNVAINENGQRNQEKKIKVNMMAWTIDDRYVITSLTDNSLKVWLAHNGKLKHVMYGHESDVFIIEPHPTDGRIVLTAGHEGAIMIWDIVVGTNIRTIVNEFESGSQQQSQYGPRGSLFDAKWNADGTMIAATDAFGHVLYYGIFSNNPFGILPDNGIFFHTDYRAIIRDVNGFVIDEQEQRPPHLMPPPFLVDVDGNPYPPQMQRLVPGREHCNDSQLIPYVDNLPHRLPNMIDNMIQQLERQRDLNNNDQNRIAEQENQRAGQQQRNQSDAEGVRNPANFVSSGGDAVVGVYMRSPLIPALSSQQLFNIQKRQNALTIIEEDYYNLERKKRPPADQDQNSSNNSTQTGHSQKMPFTRRQQRINQQRRGVRIRASHTELLHEDVENLDIDDDNDKDFTGTSEDSSDEDEETDDSDWNINTNDNVVSTSSSRKRKRAASSDDGVNEEEEEGEASHRNSRLDVDLDHDEEDEEPIESGNEPSSSRPRRTKIEDREKRRERRKRFEAMKVRRYEKQLRQVNPASDERFKLPDWFTDHYPKRTPYFPQIGDTVVYFRQGHKNYIDAIRDSKIYNILPTIKPFKLRGSEADEIFAKIVGLQYQVKPPRLVILKLMVIDPANDENPETNISFSVRYHDVPNVCDFIILKQLYDASIARMWNVNDLFRSVIDDKWWYGRVDHISYTQLNSFFQSIEVVWDSGERELLSPWDLEPIEPGEELPRNRQEGVVISDEERHSFSMIDEQEWPAEIREVDRQRLINGVLRIMEFRQAEEFSAPVDLTVHPIYAMTVPYPMDFSTILARIQSNFYRRIEALKHDVKFIESNAELYNEPDSDIVKKAKIITNTYIRFIEDRDCEDPQPIYNEVLNQVTQQQTSISENSTNAITVSNYLMDRPRRSTRRIRFQDSDSDNEDRHHVSTSSPDLGDQKRNQEVPLKHWKQSCRELIDYLFHLNDSEPFRTPVDPLDYPTYNHVIDTPMDLSTVKEQLLADIYETPSEFIKDMRLIFFNSKSFNTNKKSRIYSMTVRLSELFEEKMRQVLSQWKSASKRLRRLERVGLNHQRGTRRLRSVSPNSSDNRSQRSVLSKMRKYSKKRRKTSVDESQANQPSTSSFSSSINNSQRLSNGSSSFSDSMGKYGLRYRSSRLKKYENSDNENMDTDHEDDGQLSASSTNHYQTLKASQSKAYKLRNRQYSKRRNFKSSTDEEKDENESTEKEEEEEELENESEGSEETEVDKNDEDLNEDEEVDDEEEEVDEEEEEIDEEGQQSNEDDSDATQVGEDEEDDKENSSRRPIRAVKKRIRYRDSDSDNADIAIRERNVNVKISRQSSYLAVNESSRESHSTTRSSDVDGADSSRPLRRSQRKVRPKRNYSSDDSETEHHHHRHENNSSDLYSSVKTRHRSVVTNLQRSELTRTSMRSVQRINYNEDNIDQEEVFSSYTSSSTTRRSDNSNGFSIHQSTNSNSTANHQRSRVTLLGR